MPELPEVETIRQSLEEHVSGLQIIGVKIYWPGAVTGWQGIGFAETVTGRRIEGLGRRGKYLLITLDEGWSLIAHMRMTGRLYYYPGVTEPDKHTHMVLQLDKGELHFNDTRKFGRIQLTPTHECLDTPSLAKLGPEPLEDEFTPDLFKQRLAKKKTNLKAVLLDQTVLAGLGNIYVDESLHLAGISPERVPGDLTEDEIQSLHQSIQKVLQAGIASRGTSFRDYRDANGEIGLFQEALNVYGRGGLACRSCGTTLTKLRLAGRTTVYCPYCQR